MNIEQFIQFSNETNRTVEVEPRTIGWQEFSKDNTEATLLYGYDVDRNSFHVYLADGIVQLVRYSGGNGTGTPMKLLAHANSFTDLEQLVPNKRLYPECCDVDFCKFLRNHGVTLPFTVFNKNRAVKDFYGETL